MKSFSALRHILAPLVVSALAVVTGGAMAANNLWDLVSEVQAHPVNQQSIEKSFNIKLNKTVDTPDELRFEGAGPVFDDGIKVDKIELVRYDNGSPAPLIVNPRISGRCIKIGEIEGIYRDVAMTAAPTHGYPDAVYTYETKAANNRIAFFVNAHTQCLSSLKIFLNKNPE